MMIAEAPMPEPNSERLWTRDEYYRMAQLGLLSDDEHVELIEGRILIVSPHKSSHATAVLLTQAMLAEAFMGQDVHFRPQMPLTLGPRSEPEPDLIVARGTVRDYTARHPGPADALLVVEISDTTLVKDRLIKAPLYAAAGVEEYWIVNLVERRLEIYRQVGSGIDADVTILGEDAVATPLNAPTAQVPVARLLPAASLS